MKNENKTISCKIQGPLLVIKTKETATKTRKIALSSNKYYLLFSNKKPVGFLRSKEYDKDEYECIAFRKITIGNIFNKYLTNNSIPAVLEWWINTTGESVEVFDSFNKFVKRLAEFKYDF